MVNRELIIDGRKLKLACTLFLLMIGYRATYFSDMLFLCSIDKDSTKVLKPNLKFFIVVAEVRMH